MNYDQLALRAAQMLAKYGQTVTLRRISIKTYNAATSGVSGAAPEDVQRLAAIFTFADGKTAVRGTLIETGDRQAFMEPGIEPSVRDRMVVGETVWKIVSFGEVNPAGTPVLYDLHLRI